MNRYVKKPVVVKAWQFTKENFREGIPSELGDPRRVLLWEESNKGILKGTVNTLEGIMEISENDFIIIGVKGELYPCKPDIFDMTYEEVSG